MGSQRAELIRKIREAVGDGSGVRGLWDATSGARRNRAVTIETIGLDIDHFKEKIRAIKTGSVGHPALVEQFARNVEQNDGKVYFADNDEDAIRYFLAIAQRTKARLIVKSKSLTSDEIELNKALEQAGLKVVETDLGELICQLAREPPAHLVYPAANKTAADVASIFSMEFREKIPPEPSAILKLVRTRLRPIFLSADIGVTGANIGIAETGSIIIETNEGNGRLVSTIPRVHVVLIGMEKIVASWSDAADLVSAHAVSATGQRMTVYVSLISGRNPLGSGGEAREFHVIILDNGRRRMWEDEWFRDGLNCIRCGACMNICPTYNIVGGHVFGHIYPGPIGIPWTANVHGLEKAVFADLCVSCGLCKEICPVDIDIPMMIAKVKQQHNAVLGQPWVNRLMMSSENMAKLASATAPVSNWILTSPITRYFMEKLVGIDRRRKLPTFARRRLSSRIKKLTAGTGEAGSLVFFPDIYAEYNDPELGLKAIQLLRSLGYRVEIPDLMWSGMPYVSYGELDKAEKVAEYNLRILEQYVQKGYEILSTEPTAIYMLREVYPKLKPGEMSRMVSEKSRGFFAYIENKLDGLHLKSSMAIDSAVGFHIPCHERALASGRPAVRFLEKSGYSVKIIETGTCCGMAGTFGLKAGPLGYELSTAVGEKLFKLFREDGCKIIATESSVCAMQLKDGLGLNVWHPLHMVSEAPA